MKPGSASSAVVGGIYDFTRHPIYFGIFLMLVEWAIFLANPLSLVLIILFVAYISQLKIQIPPEERALEALFRDEFQTYKKRCDVGFEA